MCKKCGNKIPKRIKTDDGKVHFIPYRKYCFICTPFGTWIKRDNNGNPIIEMKNGKKYRICGSCKTSKEVTEENFYRRKRGGFNSYCKLCDNETSMERVKNLKSRAVEYKNGKCCICGYNRCNRSLDFHHLDPSKKDFSISERKTSDFEKLKIELDKCVLICKNCHGELHDGIITI